MKLLRFRCSGRINKPLPFALVDALPSIKNNVADLKAYARKLNEGKINEEDTNIVTWGTETDHIWFTIIIAIPMPLPQALQDKLPAIKAKIRQLKTYAVSTGDNAFVGKYHICTHGETGSCPEPQEI